MLKDVAQIWGQNPRFQKLDLILAGKKTMEVQSKSLKPGTYFLGHKQVIYGKAELGSSTPI